MSLPLVSLFLRVSPCSLHAFMLPLDPQATNADGLLKDLTNIDIGDELADDQGERTHDIKAYFHEVYTQVKNGSPRRMRDCRTCKYGLHPARISAC